MKTPTGRASLDHHRQGDDSSRATFAIDPATMEQLRQTTMNDPNVSSSAEERFEQLAKLKLPAGWKRNTDRTNGKSSSSPPYVHEDGRVSWKNPALKQILAISTAAQKEAKTTQQQESDALMKKYRRMKNSGIPEAAILNTVRIDGVMDSEVVLQNLLSASSSCSNDENENPASSSSISSTEQRYLNKYTRMLKCGVPAHGVATTIRMDGYDPAGILDEVERCVVEHPILKRLDNNPARQAHLMQKYKKMHQSGVSIHAIRSVMTRELGSVDESLLASFEEQEKNKKHETKGNTQPRHDKNDYEYFTPLAGGGAEFSWKEKDSSHHLSLLVRKMVLTVKKNTPKNTHHENQNKEASSSFQVEGKDLYDALGGLRGVQVARDLYNRTCTGKDDNAENEKVMTMSEQEVCSKRKPLLELWSSLGIRAPTRSNDTVDIAGLDDLVQFIEQSNKTHLAAIQDSVNVGMYDFDSLGELYKPGDRVLAKHVFASGVDMICQVAWNRYEQGKTLFGVTRTFKVCFQFLVAVGKHFTICEYVHTIEHFDGRRSIQSGLDFVPLTSISNGKNETIVNDMLEMFRKRGEMYSKCATSQSFLAYDKGSFFAKSTGRKAAATSSSGGDAALNSSGRVMVDTQGSYEAGHSLGIASNDAVVTAIKYKYKEYMLHQRKMDQDAKNGMNHQPGADSDLVLFDDIPEAYLEMTWPAVIGFSFTSNSWGEVLVDGLSEINFDETVFDNLVLPASRKRMVKALVRHSSDSFQDIIAGKGEGSVFLLYGPPGVGKTLTAEAISEMLHRPLYTVSLGQLGVTPTELETKLGEILDLCRRWDALILLDEADIFLEKRTSTGSLERNAMVSIMLRLVEYFKGVLFLTSNRVDTLDPAIKTRITLGLRYEQLDSTARAQVWKNLLCASGYADKLSNDSGKVINIEELAKHPLNGREIKNAIRLAIALAKEDAEDLSQELLFETIETLNDFNGKMNTAEAY